MSRGVFITFEGVEGAGKSTLVTAVAEAVRSQDQEVLQTFEPGDTLLGARIRELLLELEPPTAQAELFLFLADRAEHIATDLLPALEAGKWVFCDRFTDATIAYQGYGRQLDRQMVRQACQAASQIDPDRTYLIDLEPRVGLERTQLRGAPDRMEREALAFHERVRAGYLELARDSPQRFVVLDGETPPKELVRQVVEDLRELDWLRA